MAKLFSIKPSLVIRGRKFKGLRGWAGKPFHPPLTDVPVAAYILGAVFDLLSVLLYDEQSATAVVTPGSVEVDFGISMLSHDLWRAATFVFIAGAIVSLPTMLTGFWDWLKSTPRHTQAWRTANWHMALMLTTTVLVIANLVWRLTIDDQLHTPLLLALLSVAIAGIVSFGALYGGALVYEMGFNVETAGDSPVWHESEVDVIPGQH